MVGALLFCLTYVRILAEVLTCSQQFAREVASLASKVAPGSDTAAVSGKNETSLFISVLIRNTTTTYRSVLKLRNAFENECIIQWVSISVRENGLITDWVS